MKLPYEWQIGWRYTRTGRRTAGNGFISFISLISMGGIALGVSALIIVLSVMNGFQKEVRDRMLSVLRISKYFRPQALCLTGVRRRMKRAVIQKCAPPRPMSKRKPCLRAEAPLAALRGIDPTLEKQISSIAMKAGDLSDLKAGGFGIALGAQLAEDLAVLPGDTLTVIAPLAESTPVGLLPRYKLFRVSGIFESGHYEFDRSLALIHMADAQTLFRLEAPTGVRVRLNDMQRAPAIARALARSLSGQLYVRDWTTQNRTWFAAVQVEKRMMFIILMLIIAVAAFNLVSSLVMTVTSK